MVKTPEYDVEVCQWCRGDGKDHGSMGLGQNRTCQRCQGSGRVLVTDRESVTGRRRNYKGAAPFGSKLSGPNEKKQREEMKKRGARFPKNLEAVLGKPPAKDAPASPQDKAPGEDAGLQVPANG